MSDLHTHITVHRGKLRTARKVHECVGAGDYEPDTGWTPTKHPIEIGEPHVQAWHVYSKFTDHEGITYPMGSVSFRMCLECALEDHMISIPDGYALESTESDA